VEVERVSIFPPMRSMVGKFSSTASDERLQLNSGHSMNSSSRNSAIATSSVHENIQKQGKDCGNTSITKRFTPNIACGRLRKSVDGGACSSEQLQGLFLFLECFHICS
jgi:hypothetical protein